MRLLRLASRTLYTGFRLPFAIAWDIIRAPALSWGSPSSTAKVLREHEQIKRIDEYREGDRHA